MPAISVVVPTYERAALLERLLHALDQQGPVEGGFEVIVVDDGSTDGTAAVAAAHPGVRYLRQDNSGPACARNRGWRAATAPVVAFTDDDTVPQPAWLAELLEVMDAEQFDALGGAVHPARATPAARFVQADRLVNHAIDDDGSIRFLITANLAVRVPALEAVDGFDEAFRTASGEDVDLTWRLAASGARLGTTTRAVVVHDHPTTWRGVFALYAKHGRARSELVDRHPAQSMGNPSQWRLLSPARLVRRYRRAGTSWPRTAEFLLVRYAGLAVALVSSRRG